MHRSEQRGEQLREQGFADPSKPKTRHRDAQLRRAKERVEIGNDQARDFCPARAPEGKRIELSLPNSHECKLRRDEEAVQQDQHQHEQDLPDRVACDGEHKSGGDELLLHRLTSPKMTSRTSCKLITPISRCSRPKTMPRRWPLRCMRRRATSSRRSSSR